MRLVHDPEDVIGEGSSESRVLATDVEVADSTLSQAKGLMFRRSIGDDFALVMDVDGGLLSSGPSRQFVHMLCMRFPIDVVWLADDRVTKTARLSPWTGVGVGKADRIVELPAGGSDGVSPGDTVRLEGGE